jgi:hypothetical protein
MRTTLVAAVAVPRGLAQGSLAARRSRSVSAARAGRRRPPRDGHGPGSPSREADKGQIPEKRCERGTEINEKELHTTSEASCSCSFTFHNGRL